MVVDRKALIPAGADIGIVIVSARAADVNEEIVIILKREFAGQDLGAGSCRPASLSGQVMGPISIGFSSRMDNPSLFP